MRGEDVKVFGYAAILFLLSLASSTGRAMQTDGSSSPAEQTIVTLTNQARAEHGLPALRWDAALADAARAHAGWMVRNGHLDHQFQGEASLLERAGKSGAHFSAIAENIALGPSPEAIVKQWMNSQAHRTNILDPQMNAIGVALIENSGTLYAVEDFANGVEQFTPEQVEQKVAAMLKARGVDPSGPAQDARALCADGDANPPAPRDGTRPATVARWQGPDLSKLPEVVEQQLRSGRFTQAAVGSCQSQGGSGFSTYRVAVLLY